MDLKLVPVEIAVSGSVEGRLVFLADSLVAVLVLLGDLHEGNAGKWFLEIAFHEKIIDRGHIFGSLIEAESWITDCLASSCNREDHIRRTKPNRT
ncbi:hypothetical protein [Methylobacterium nonmethylotrophicum]|uniref:Uncharacterized protein n=1 Tax=Methylobacterium nonmethylotrophicum TaxID=1141884 RepID=A0A4Z0NNR9_9HYPH|nr:hypothetical protein [Methylobacterium nonmethylotrophicum]TGD97664.1 hypothetical protein EU555_18675 [Methylobacterium nonmethylotrophicum]